MSQPSPPKTPTEAEHLIRNLEQAKVLADPLRIRILQSFCQERTTKQVADALGEKPTKLYHHVDALEKVGLIRLSRTRPNRGTLEKYYLAIARTFRTDSRIFEGADEPGEGKDTLAEMLSTIFGGTAAELRQIVERGDGSRDIEQRGIVTFVEMHGDKKMMDGYRRRLNRLLRDIQRDAECVESSGDETRYRLTLAFYPLDAPDDAG